MITSQSVGQKSDSGLNSRQDSRVSGMGAQMSLRGITLPPSSLSSALGPSVSPSISASSFPLHSLCTGSSSAQKVCPVLQSQAPCHFHKKSHSQRALPCPLSNRNPSLLETQHPLQLSACDSSQVYVFSPCLVLCDSRAWVCLVFSPLTRTQAPGRLCSLTVISSFAGPHERGVSTIPTGQSKTLSHKRQELAPGHAAGRGGRPGPARAPSALAVLPPRPRAAQAGQRDSLRSQVLNERVILLWAPSGRVKSLMRQSEKRPRWRSPEGSGEETCARVCLLPCK